ncbi:MAG: nicotinate-nucleotide--dimethylbenzimidazole phosphoribosyltransferase [Rhodospirillales bacterium]|nr:nicotinate-nucleotide--dimethylbenzimidazole phosphoribosyltransferase [Rhodospirillales bacterium]
MAETGASLTSLDDFRKRLAQLPPPDEAAAEKAREREPNLTKPPGSLGRLEEIALWLATWQGRHPPAVNNVRALVFAGNHGVTAQGVSAYPAEVTEQMVGNFQAGGAAINQICKSQGADLRVFSMSLDNPTKDFTVEPAMADEEAAGAANLGMNAVEAGQDLICLGEMGIGNTSSAAAICMALFGGKAADWAGPGTGVEGDALANKVKVIGGAVKLHKKAMSDGLEILRHLGGHELAAIAGAILAARALRQPAVLDGFVACAAAAPLFAVNPSALDHCIVGHVSAEPGHKRLLEKLGKVPLFDFGMRLGEASGAALAIGVLRTAAACHAGMATFGEAGVTDKD